MQLPIAIERNNISADGSKLTLTATRVKAACTTNEARGTSAPTLLPPATVQRRIGDSGSRLALMASGTKGGRHHAQGD